MNNSIFLNNSKNSIDINSFNKLHVNEKLNTIRLMPAKEKMDMILYSSDAGNIVSKMPVEELFYLIKEIGESDALDLVTLSSAEQTKIMIDIDCWFKDNFDSDKFIKWLELIIASGDVKLIKTINSVDMELFVLMLKGNVRVFIKESEDEEEIFLRDDLISMDNTFYYQFIRDAPESKLIDFFLKKVYQLDHRFYISIMYGIYSELGADLLEASFSLKNTRLTEYGYPPYYEALDLYAICYENDLNPVDDNGHCINDTGLYSIDYFYFLPESVFKDSYKNLFINRFLASNPSIDNRRFQNEIVYLFNCIIVIDIRDHGDINYIKDRLKREYTTLSLGLEILCSQDINKAEGVINRYRLFDIFKIGNSRKRLLRDKARSVINEFKFIYDNKQSINLLDFPYNNILKGLLLDKPLFFDGLTDILSIDYREILSLDDLFFCEEKIEEIKSIDNIFHNDLGFSIEDIFELPLEDCIPNSLIDLTLSCIFLTAMANDILFGRFECVPIDLKYLKGLYLDTVVAVRTGDISRHKLKKEIKERYLEKVLGSNDKVSENKKLYSVNFIERAFEIFDEEFASINLKETIDPRFFRCFIIRACSKIMP